MTSTVKDPSEPTQSDLTPKSERAVIWILDDSPLESALARRALTANYDVETFTDGSTLLERIAAGPSPSVLLLDWQLPGMSGIEVCRFLRSERDETDLPILMLTVYGHKSDLVDGLGAGANDYLTKPYDAPELAARVATLVKIKSLHEKNRREEARNAELLARERISRADAETANAAKDQFLAMVSHDLRTPLNAILGWTRMVRSGSLGPEQHEKALEIVERNALAQAKLIEDLMDTSRILSGNLQLDIQPVELVGLINVAVDAVRPSAQAKDIALKVNVALDAGQISGDPHRLQQVVWNLLTNAIKFTPNGGTVTTSLRRAHEKLELSITDSGRGIDPKFLPHVFERFRQAESSGKHAQGEGLGLGLAIVKQIVELHGAKVEARSSGIGTGATFTIEFLRAADSAGSRIRLSDADHTRATIARSKKLAGLHLLVVDDEPDGLALFATALENFGAEVVAVSSAAAARAAVATKIPNVLISDVGMPLEDGHSLIRSLRALPAEKGGLIPALALTAFNGVNDRADALAAGFNMYATKPIDITELVLSVATLAGRLGG
jgi:signal transduction histidine kinase